MVTDSKLFYIGLKSKCEKWCKHKWVGSTGPVAHGDLWSEFWSRLLLLGDSVSIQWVLSHVGMEGNEQADQQAAKGAKRLHQQLLQHKAVTNIWAAA